MLKNHTKVAYHVSHVASSPVANMPRSYLIRLFDRPLKVASTLEGLTSTSDMGRVSILPFDRLKLTDHYSVVLRFVESKTLAKINMMRKLVSKHPRKAELAYMKSGKGREASQFRVRQRLTVLSTARQR